MNNTLPIIDWQTPIVDPDTGTPTPFFLTVWQSLLDLNLNSLADVDLSNPTDGQVLTYSAATKKWIAA